jgi:hypothetical protein
LAQSYSLTWHDIYTILSSILLLKERRRVSDMAKTHAYEIHCTTSAHLWEHWWFQRQNPIGTIKLMA